MGEQVRVSPKCGEKLKWGFESPTAPKKCLTNFNLCAIIHSESEVSAMVEIIDFVLANAESIVSYEVIDYSMDATIGEFTMVNGEKIQKDF